MLYESILAFHLLGACATACVGSFVLYVLAREHVALYKNLTLILGGLAAYEVTTGVALAVSSYDVRAVALCTNIALYLAAVTTLEFLLYQHMRTRRAIFPLVQVFSPIAASVAVLCAAVIVGI